MTNDDIRVWKWYTSKITHFIPRVFHRPTPKTQLDLHHLPIQAAFEQTKLFIENSHYNKTTQIEIITGKSGIIRNEFPEWCNHPHIKKYIKSVKQSHPKNDGSWIIKIR